MLFRDRLNSSLNASAAPHPEELFKTTETSTSVPSTTSSYYRLQGALDTLKLQHAALVKSFPSHTALDASFVPAHGPSLSRTTEEDGAETPTLLHEPCPSILPNPRRLPIASLIGCIRPSIRQQNVQGSRHETRPTSDCT